MKNTNYIFILTLWMGVAFSACKKETPKPVEIDCRDFFVGTYQGVRSTTVSVYAGTPSHSIDVDSNVVYTLTKKGDYPSTEISKNGASYFLLPDDKSHTILRNLNGDNITVRNFKMSTYSSYWFSSYENYTTRYQGTRIQ